MKLTQYRSIKNIVPDPVLVEFETHKRNLKLQYNINKHKKNYLFKTGTAEARSPVNR